MHSRIGCVILLIAFANATFAEQLGKPFMVTINGVPLDVEQRGQTAPFYGDFDGDGKRDLLVGAFGYKTARMRIYRNVGSNASPEFQDFTRFRNGEVAFRNTTFHPQLVDFDGDGRVDVFTGNWPGQLSWFPGREDGFDDAVTLNDADGDPIQLDWMFSAFAVDVDADGDADVVAACRLKGERTGTLARLENIGGGKFSKPIVIKDANDEPINMLSFHLDVVLADWDGSGTDDLILGEQDGRVLWYSNDGTNTAPKYAGPKELLVAPGEGDERGNSARVCVADWNDDGKLDLIVGENGKEFMKELGPGEIARKEQARILQQESFAAWTEHYQMFQSIRKKKDVDPDFANRILKTAKKGMQAARISINQAHATQEGIKPGKQTHGRVWVCLRQ